MSASHYFFDTHALIFWRHKLNVSDKFIDFFDEQAKLGNLFISSVVFWEIALLAKKGRIEIEDVSNWRNDLLANAPIKIIVPDDSDMISSVEFPDHHKDPFDRLLIAQSLRNDFVLVSQDREFAKYDVKTIWVD